MTQYCDRDTLKMALSLPATATGAHALLDAALEAVSREIDAFVGFGFHPSTGTRYYRADNSVALALDYPLTGVDSLNIDGDGDASYESTVPASGYYLLPDNATAGSPAQPFWAIELGSGASAAFPVGQRRGVKITGTWGYYDQREETTGHPATAIDATQTRVEFTGASDLHPGQTLRVDGEQMFVVDNGLSGSDTATTSGSVTVRRAQNNSAGATHSSNSTMSVYVYPVIDRATLMQAEMDHRALDAPLGSVAGDMAGSQTLRVSGGLHPFCKAILHTYREPVAR